MQIISLDITLRSDTVHALKEFNNQSLATQAEQEEQLVSMLPAIKKIFDLMGDDIVDLSTENDALKNKIGAYDEKWLQESIEKLVKQIDDEKRANLIMFRMKKQMKTKNLIMYNYTYSYTNNKVCIILHIIVSKP